VGMVAFPDASLSTPIVIRAEKKTRMLHANHSQDLEMSFARLHAIAIAMFLCLLQGKNARGISRHKVIVRIRSEGASWVQSLGELVAQGPPC